MKYAIINLNGKQLKVTEGQEFTTEHIATTVGEKITADQVLMVGDENDTQIGQPLVKNAKVILEVLSTGKTKTLRVATYKAKSRERKVYGHRQPTFTLKVASISLK
jgi:large subunit ribosomal protein L21